MNLQPITLNNLKVGDIATLKPWGYRQPMEAPEFTSEVTHIEPDSRGNVFSFSMRETFSNGKTGDLIRIPENYRLVTL